MFRIEFYGCDPEEVLSEKLLTDSASAATSTIQMPPREKGSDRCIPDQTVRSDDPDHYRTIAVDTEHGNIVYFCDRSPYREGMQCYTSRVNRNNYVWKGESFVPTINRL